MHDESILVLDFGSQYTQLIARRIRELGVYSEIKPFNIPIDDIRLISPAGIILSGGPSSVYQSEAPLIDKEIMELDVPILGICYGLQLITHLFGGQVIGADHREYGHADLYIETTQDPLLNAIDSPTHVWMSHGDKIARKPPDFRTLAHTRNSPHGIIRHQSKPIFGLQFHPEVAHTKQGHIILKNFLYEVCGCKGSWTPHSFVEHSISSLREKIGNEKVICALSGGVDSSVAAVLLSRAIGRQLIPIFIDNGLLRTNEAEEVQSMAAKHFSTNFRFVDARERFLRRLQHVTDPEKKRKIIGEEFIRVFEDAASREGEVRYLVQGTLYPDVIESISTKGPSAVIKSHHNVGGLPQTMKLTLIEPLRELFKDEVRRVGSELGLPDHIIGRHPFPGPGLAVRTLGDITEQKLTILRQSDVIFIEELRAADLYNDVWQAFTVLLPVQTVGVMGDERTYENAIALRAVTSQDAMTADWAQLPYDLLKKVSNRIINEVKGVNRVVYDISSKPPSTIEWE
ncbi:glutamine-hydrolyzing GMP synthase [candidate division KSB1 bacterium]|nr:glutamine-hydrolyzing GMP synthase [candidate division KSB1 bacterium]